LSGSIPESAIHVPPRAPFTFIGPCFIYSGMIDTESGRPL